MWKLSKVTIMPNNNDFRTYLPSEIEFRQNFAAEYVKDNDAVNALMRCGMVAVYAMQHAAEIMEEPYVQELISRESFKFQELDATKELKEESIMELRRIISSKTAKDNDKISAISKLSSIYGWESNGNSELPSGVMIVPAMTDIDSWSTMAVASQDMLREKMYDMAKQIELKEQEDAAK
jgi:hypothetical protein